MGGQKVCLFTFKYCTLLADLYYVLILIQYTVHVSIFNVWSTYEWAVSYLQQPAAGVIFGESQKSFYRVKITANPNGEV